MTKISVIYVPGLGDKNLSSRRKLLSLWHFKDISIEICSMQWSVHEPWGTKLQRLLDLIEKRKKAGNSVCMIGESAGASAAINALAATESIDSIVLLCGKTQHPERVVAWRYQQNPALKDALINSDKAVQSLSDLQKDKILNLHPFFDPVVSVVETKIPNVQNSTMPILGHATSIAFANTLWSWRIVHFFRKNT